MLLKISGNRSFHPYSSCSGFLLNETEFTQWSAINANSRSFLFLACYELTALISLTAASSSLCSFSVMTTSEHTDHSPFWKVTGTQKTRPARRPKCPRFIRKGTSDQISRVEENFKRRRFEWVCLTWLAGLTHTDHTQWEDLRRGIIVDPRIQGCNDSSGRWNSCSPVSFERNGTSTWADQALELVLQPFSVRKNKENYWCDGQHAQKMVFRTEDEASQVFPHTCKKKCNRPSSTYMTAWTLTIGCCDWLGKESLLLPFRGPTSNIK